MSISSTSNTLSSPSSVSSVNSTPQPSSLRTTPSTTSSSSASPILALGDQLSGAGDGDEDDNIFRKSKAIVDKQQSAKQDKQSSITTTTTTTTITNTSSSGNNEKQRSDKLQQTSKDASRPDLCHNEVKVATSTPRPAGTVLKRPEIVTSATPTILKRAVAPTPVQPTSMSSIRSKNVVVTNVVGCQAKPPQVSGTAASHQQSANKWRLSTKLETTCNILSKSTQATSSLGTNKSASSIISSHQPELVASLPSLSSNTSTTTTGTATTTTTATATTTTTTTTTTTHNASQVINFRTLPLLMNHNHHFQASVPFVAGGANTNTKGNLISPNKTPTLSAPPTSSTRPMISNISPQIILSQIINANPTQRQQHHSTITTSANFTEGLQFCLNASTTSSQANTDVSPASTMATTKVANNNNNNNNIGISTSMQTSAASVPLTTDPAASSNSQAKSKVKPHSQSSSANNKNIDTTSNGDPGDLSANNVGNNIAAARLLDLGKKLLEATREGKLDQVRHLVEESGAPFTSDWLGTTALHLAAQGGHADIAGVLVRAGVNRDARTKLERTALHLAAQSGCLEIVDLLLTHGSDENARDMLRMTPLHWAVERGHVYVAERLLISGADAELSNKFLLTPLDIARELASYEMIELFKNWTGDSLNDDQNLESFSNAPHLPDVALNESQDFLDIDYHLALVDSATNSRGADSMDLDKATSEPCLDLVEFEWNKFDFDADLFLPSESDEEHKVDFLMKVVEDLKKENHLLRQKVEQLSTGDE